MLDGYGGLLNLHHAERGANSLIEVDKLDRLRATYMQASMRRRASASKGNKRQTVMRPLSMSTAIPVVPLAWNVTEVRAPRFKTVAGPSE